MIALMPDDNHLPLHPLDEAMEQGAESEKNLSRQPADYLHFPWPSLDQAVGGIAPGQIWFIGAFSGHGKTTFAMSAMNEWFNQGKRIYYMGLESRPSVLRTQWACQRLGLNAGDVLSGKMATQADWQFTRKKLMEEIHWQTQDDRSSRVYFSPEKFVGEKQLRRAYDQAEDLGSDLVAVDHVDHLGDDGLGLYETSVRMHKTMLDSGQRTGIPTIALTQFNNEVVKTNRLALHMPPSPSAVYMGGHKRQVCRGMLGLYKPFKADITKDELAKFARGELEPIDVIERGVMAALIMKHSLYGEREGKRVLLGVNHGKVIELEERDRFIPPRYPA